MWKPIETAPKDGTAILLLSAPYEDIVFDEAVNHPARIAIGHWWAEGSSWVPDGPLREDAVYTLQQTGVWSSGGGWFQPDEVTHWMPLPPANPNWRAPRKMRAAWRRGKIHKQAMQILDLVAKVERLEAALAPPTTWKPEDGWEAGEDAVRAVREKEGGE